MTRLWLTWLGTALLCLSSSGCVSTRAAEPEQSLVARIRAAGGSAEGVTASSAPPPSLISQITQSVNRAAPDADALHAAALIDLTWGENTPAMLARPVRVLRSAARLSPAAPQLHADLSTALRRLGTATGDPLLRLEGLDHAMRAAALLPSDRNAANAVANARRSIGLDSTDAAYRLSTADSLWQVLLPAWSDAILTGDSTASRAAIDAVDAFASAAMPDQAPRRVLAELRSACRSRSRCEDIAHAVKSLAFARNSIAHLRLDRAESPLRSARRKAGPASLVAMESQLQSALMLIHRGKRAAGLKYLQRLASTAEERGLLSIRARIAWASGTVAFRDGRLDDALQLYAIARTGYERAHDTDGVLAMTTLGADVGLVTGRRRDALRQLLEVLPLAPTDRPSVRRYSVLLLIGRECTAAGWHKAAHHLLLEALRAVSGPLQAGDRAEAYAVIADNAAAAGDALQYADALARLRALRDSVDDSTERDFVQASAQLLEAERTASRPTASTAAMVDSAGAFMAKIGYRLGAFRAFVVRGDALRAQGATVPAAAAFDSALQLVEAERGTLGRRPEAVRTFGRARSAVERYVRTAALQGGDIADALQTLRRARRSLASYGAALRAAPLASNEARLTLAIIDSQRLAFVEDGENIVLDTASIDEARLRASIDRVNALLSSDADSAAALAQLRHLHEQLVPTALLRISGKRSSLVIDVDGVLDAVPFVLLRDPSSGRFLGERFAVRYAGPTLPHTARPKRVFLAIADPAFAQSEEPFLRRLQGAAQEAQALRRLWPDATVLADSSATRDRVMTALQSAGRFHFAGHSVSEPGRPDAARLVVAAGGGSRGSITALELATTALDGLELAVLAACGSAASSDDATAVRGLGDAFLIAGARRVVGSLWPVDDAATRHLMAKFYAEIKAGRSAEEALQRAQLQSRRDGQLRPSQWGAWRVMGN